MTTILDTIIEHKKMEVLKRKGRKPVEALKEKPLYQRTPVDPTLSFNGATPKLIAEFKRRSPSKGMLSDVINPVPLVRSYMEGGAVASSILTDRDFFGGSFRDLENVKLELPDYPLLRKDFIVDPYQVHEAKAYGADLVLLIAAVLDKKQVKELTKMATGLGMNVLLEVHTVEETDHWNQGIRLIGVNNRDLKDFSVDIERSLSLFSSLPSEAIKISESGLNDPEEVRQLFQAGFSGFLMGEKFMKSGDPGTALREFISDL